MFKTTLETIKIYILTFLILCTLPTMVKPVDTADSTDVKHDTV